MSLDKTNLAAVSGMLLMLGVGLWAGIYIGKAWHVKQDLAHWDKTAAKQYDAAVKDGGKWGEVVHEYEGFSCEAHRWRYRDVYYIGHVGFDCGDLIREPLHK